MSGGAQLCGVSINSSGLRVSWSALCGERRRCPRFWRPSRTGDAAQHRTRRAGGRPIKSSGSLENESLDRESVRGSGADARRFRGLGSWGRRVWPAGAGEEEEEEEGGEEEEARSPSPSSDIGRARAPHLVKERASWNWDAQLQQQVGSRVLTSKHTQWHARTRTHSNTSNESLKH